MGNFIIAILVTLVAVTISVIHYNNRIDAPSSQAYHSQQSIHHAQAILNVYGLLETYLQSF